MWPDVGAGGAAAWDPPPTLRGADYTGAEAWDLERARIFHGGWFCAGRDEDVGAAPGSFAPVDVAGEGVVLVRGDDGVLRGFLNSCRHRGARLCDLPGRVGRALVCPYHAWSYGLDGRLLATPNVGRDERIGRERLGLVPVRVEIWEGFVWVSLADDPGPLLDHLVRWASDDPFQWSRYDVGGLVEGARREYDVAANWKILVENYNECLHCPTVHPHLVKLVPVYRHGEVEEAGGGNANTLAAGATSFTRTGTSTLPPLPGLRADDERSFYGVTLLPNLIVNYHAETVSTFLLLPQAPDRTRVVCHYLFPPDVVGGADLGDADVVSYRHELALEDWAVCERAQAGAGSRAFAAGGVLPYADRYLHAFHRAYLAMRADLPVTLP
jgi:Rieske 2Fe-2S family protein